jgi:transposase InsO family protein
MEEHELDKHKRVWSVRGVALSQPQSQAEPPHSPLQQRTCLIDITYVPATTLHSVTDCGSTAYVHCRHAHSSRKEQS